ncbi:MAG TPA: geranylgeranyl reductase family protein [Acidimicrobiia bacterium]|nr:geranylgeranyl reductase family protein [Acidimicrobiia bacterium]
MNAGRFDALVVGSGPAGSIAATVLARGGARVALVDKAKFPRDKACGDLVGPRGVQLLSDLGIAVPGALKVDDMIVVGPTARRVRLPCYPGRTYPGHGFALRRVDFDAALRNAAVDAGAEAFIDRAADPLWGDGGLEGFALSSGAEVRADIVIGADGASSRVATAANLVDPSRVLWGFAVRGYVEEAVDVPYIVLWEHARWRAFPGYGWLFPGPDGTGNVGLGLGTLSTRAGAATAARELPAFMRTLRDHGLLASSAPATTLGGWLKLGMIGTNPARGRVLLTGDAAGLVNPLQGEGISQAMSSGRAAAQAVLTGPAEATRRYRAYLANTYAPYHSTTAPAHRALLPRPRVVSAVGRALTAPALGPLLAPGWSIFWNDLLDGAQPTVPRAVAALAAGIGRTATARGRTHDWFTSTLVQGSDDEANSASPPNEWTMTAPIC